MFLLLLDNSDIYDLTADQLKYIPKIILLRQFYNYIDYLWDRLPDHIKADLEIQQYRRCLKHYIFAESSNAYRRSATVDKEL